MADILLVDAVLAFNPAVTKTGVQEWARVFTRRMGRSGSEFLMTNGAVFSKWSTYTDEQRVLQMLIDAWHAATFHGAPVEKLHEALLVIPEYRRTLADDCLPEEYQHER